MLAHSSPPRPPATAPVAHARGVLQRWRRRHAGVVRLGPTPTLEGHRQREAPRHTCDSGEALGLAGGLPVRSRRPEQRGHSPRRRHREPQCGVGEIVGAVQRWGRGRTDAGRGNALKIARRVVRRMDTAGVWDGRGRGVQVTGQPPSAHVNMIIMLSSQRWRTASMCDCGRKDGGRNGECAEGWGLLWWATLTGSSLVVVSGAEWGYG